MTASTDAVSLIVAERKPITRLAAVGDLHVRKTSQGTVQPIVAPVADDADALLLTGDLTDHGLPDEAIVLAKELAAIAKQVPVIGVLGNHDYDAGHAPEIVRILEDIGVNLLDGDAVEIGHVGFTGVKGFVGGFGERALQPWGEGTLKRFVQETVEETLRLESGLAQLRTSQRVVLLHYSPVRETVEGEPLEIYPFLGSSRLEDPINRFHATVAFHGHAHRGAPSGTTREGVPVFNTALPLLRRLRPPGSPLYYLHELPPAQGGPQ